MNKLFLLNYRAAQQIFCLLMLSLCLFALPAWADLDSSQLSEAQMAEAGVCLDGREAVFVQSSSCPTQCSVKSETCLLCPTCGDNCLQPGEECDGTATELADGESCSDSCKIIKCGDGIINQHFEQCDGDAVASAEVPEGTICTESCEFGPYCGDGIVNGDEQCDGDKGCTENCELSRCGDGIYDPTIDGTCESAASSGQPGYAANCRSAGPAQCSYCGDGIIQEGADEVCDNGTLGSNAPAGATCADNCLSYDPYCGDNIVNLPGEECDGTDLGDFSGNPQAKCVECKIASFCGDGHVDDGELCDDGNSNNDDECRNDCNFANPCVGIEPEGQGDVYVKYNNRNDTYHELKGRNEALTPGAIDNDIDARTKVCLPGEYDFVTTSDVEFGQRGFTDENRGFYIDEGENSLDWGVAGFRPDVVLPDGTRVKDSDSPFADTQNGLSRELLANLVNKLLDAGLLTAGACPNPFEESCINWGLNGPYIDFRDQLNAGTIIDAEYYKDAAQNICYTCAWVRIVGCFSSETLITLADGSQKLISELSSGDLVLNPVTGNAQEVEFVMESSEEEDLVTVTTSSGKTLTVTANHPIATIDGTISAEKLSQGSVVLVAGGYESVADLSIEAAVAGQTVLNLMLKTDSIDLDDHMVLADGVIAGDQYVQEVLAATK